MINLSTNLVLITACTRVNFPTVLLRKFALFSEFGSLLKSECSEFLFLILIIMKINLGNSQQPLGKEIVPLVSQN